MKKSAHLLSALFLGTTALCLCAGATAPPAHAASPPPSTNLYRLYNPNSGEHFYTQNLYEASSLQKIGWNYEGTQSKQPTSGLPVYRLYNPNVGYHFYTSNTYERQNLINHGWRYEGVAFCSGGAVPMHRTYSPQGGVHNYTTNIHEQNALINLGWRNEGIAFTTTALGNPNDNSLPRTVNVMRAMTGDYWNYPSQLTAYPNLATAKNLNIEVSKAAQRVYIKSGNTVIYTMYCSTGKAGLGNTPSGNFAIQNVRGPVLWQYGYGVARNYVSFSGYGIYLFHTVVYNPNGTVDVAQAQQLGKSPMSHGCIRLSIPDAQWFYSNIPTDTPVRIY